MSQTNWTEKELATLREYYPSEGQSVSAKLPGRSSQACKAKAMHLGLKCANTWTTEEITLLTKYYSAEGTSVAKRLPGRNPESCRKKAAQLGIKATVRSGRGRPSKWTEEEIRILKEYYPAEGFNVALRLPGHAPRSCAGKANGLKIKVTGKLGKWTEEEVAILEKYYPCEGRRVTARLPGRSLPACKNKASRIKTRRKQ